jgi:hypothetical protein
MILWAWLTEITLCFHVSFARTPPPHVMSGVSPPARDNWGPPRGRRPGLHLRRWKVVEQLAHAREQLARFEWPAVEAAAVPQQFGPNPGVACRV